MLKNKASLCIHTYVHMYVHINWPAGVPALPHDIFSSAIRIGFFFVFLFSAIFINFVVVFVVLDLLVLSA